MEQMSKFNKDDGILFMLLPFWTPLIPPMGITCLKTYLDSLGYRVKALDVNTDTEFWELYRNYTQVLEEVIPKEQKGNFYNTVNEVLQKHQMLQLSLRHNDKQLHKYLIKLVKEYFFYFVDMQTIDRLCHIIFEFYHRMEHYLEWVITENSPRIIGLSVFSGNLPASLFAFSFIKHKYPWITTVMGGGVFANQLEINSVNFINFVKKTPYIDKIFVGEGELIWREFLKGSFAEKKVCTRKDIGDQLLPLDHRYGYDFSDFDLAGYTQLAAYISRGCPYQCKFCTETMHWGTYRVKNIEQAVDDMITMCSKYPFQIVLLCDSLLNPFINELSQEFIRKKSVLYWDGYLRANENICTDENVSLWRKAGFYRARIGAESGSLNVLKSMNKKITPDQIRHTVRLLAKYGIKTTTYWVIGYPGETETDFMETLNLIEELKDDLYEADCNMFKYYQSGQVGAQQWTETYGVAEKYKAELEHYFIQEWTLNTEPKMEVVHARVNRFMQHCRELGIANPYLLKDIYQADLRWSQLHQNAVPHLVDLKKY